MSGLGLERSLPFSVEGVENRAVCLTAINLYINKFAGTFPQRCKLFYDLRNLLLSVDKIKTDENVSGSGGSECFQGVFHGVLRREDCGDNWPCHGPYETLALTLTDTNSPVKLSDVTKVPEQFGYDRSPELALELIVSQYCMDNQQDHICFPGGNNYLMNPGGAGFQPHELPTIKGGCYVAVGSQKTVRLIKGTPQNPNLPALVIESGFRNHQQRIAVVFQQKRRFSTTARTCCRRSWARSHRC